MQTKNHVIPTLLVPKFTGSKDSNLAAPKSLAPPPTNQSPGDLAVAQGSLRALPLRQGAAPLATQGGTPAGRRRRGSPGKRHGARLQCSDSKSQLDSADILKTIV